MNERELDGLLASVVDDGPIHAPDWLIEAALSEIPTTPQRGAPVLPWRRPMFKPLALVIATAALIALLAMSLAGGAIGPGPSPTPAATPTPTDLLTQVRPYTTSVFAPAITFPLAQGGITGYQVSETPTMVTIRPPGQTSERLVLVRLNGTRVVGDGRDGDAALLDTLVTLLDGRAGITAVQQRRSDVDQPLSYRVADVDAPVVAVQVDPTLAAIGSPILRTATGETIDVADEPWSLFIMPAVGTTAGDLLVIYHGSVSDFGSYWATLLSIPADLRPAGA